MCDTGRRFCENGQMRWKRLAAVGAVPLVLLIAVGWWWLRGPHRYPELIWTNPLLEWRVRAALPEDVAPKFPPLRRFGRDMQIPREPEDRAAAIRKLGKKS